MVTMSAFIQTSIQTVKHLLVEVFVISRIIKVEVWVSLTETLIIPDVTETESNNNCFIIH